MNKKQSVAIVFGGKSGEHEVSLMSAKSIYQAIDKEKYDVTLIGIDKQGQWLVGQGADFLLNSENPKLIALNTQNSTQIIPRSANNQIELYSTTENKLTQKIDVFFNVIHGTTGEDGAIQGLFEMLGAAYVGAGVLGSAVGMDKEVMKKLLRDAGIQIGKFRVVKKHDFEKFNYQEAINELKYPLFVKPANSGSSVGVSKVKNYKELQEAIQKAFAYDHKVLIEKCIVGREIECSVLGNDDPQASICGEIIPQHEFYSYDAKYIDADGAKLAIPAEIDPEVQKEIQRIAVKAFKTLECRGLARVDFFLTEDNEIYVNEINTLPGFTKISMYPKLWEASGLSYPDLIDRLIQFALEYHEQKKSLESNIK
jgi:D-alanine-D-alanine ligase